MRWQAGLDGKFAALGVPGNMDWHTERAAEKALKPMPAVLIDGRGNEGIVKLHPHVAHGGGRKSVSGPD